VDQDHRQPHAVILVEQVDVVGVSLADGDRGHGGPFRRGDATGSRDERPRSLARSKGALLRLIQQTRVHGPGGTAELPVRYLICVVDTAAATCQHCTQMTRNLVAALGDYLVARLVGRRIASSARLHGQAWWLPRHHDFRIVQVVLP
jgi:hypothetical protein